MANMPSTDAASTEKKDAGQRRNVNEPTEEDQMLVDRSDWMIRPCAVYDAEKWECVKPRGRFYQLYINGEFTDCSIWLKLMKDCRKWTNDDDIAAAARIIRHEKEKVERRLQTRLDNDIWVRREERPPSNWNDPLPPHIAATHVDSYLSKYQDELNTFTQQKGSWCSIS